jgi:large subunit ribosomal protein L31
MKKDIHPKIYQAKVSCTCGNSFTVGSTKQEIQVEICSACHPFFTGEMKYVDTAGRVDKFIAKRKAAEGKKVLKKKDKRRLKEEERKRAEAAAPKSLREMVADVRRKQKTVVPPKDQGKSQKKSKSTDGTKQIKDDSDTKSDD